MGIGSLRPPNLHCVIRKYGYIKHKGSVYSLYNFFLNSGLCNISPRQVDLVFNRMRLRSSLLTTRTTVDASWQYAYTRLSLTTVISKQRRLIIIIIAMTMFMALSPWHDQSHCESSLGSSDECRLSAGWPPTLRPSQSTWAVSPPKIGSYHPHPPSPLLLLLSP